MPTITQTAADAAKLRAIDQQVERESGADLRAVDRYVEMPTMSDDRDDVAGLRNIAREYARESAQLALSGEVTDKGLAARLAPRRAELLKSLDAFEGRTAAATTALDRRRDEISRGPARTKELTAADAVVAMEIRNIARGMAQSQLLELVTTAHDRGDHATLWALEEAPASLPILSDSARSILRDRRLAAAGWDDQPHRDRLAGRTHVAQLVRRALGLTAK